MNTHLSLWTSLSALGLVALGASGAVSQSRLWSLDELQKGNGRLLIGSRTWDLDSARVELRSGGEMKIHLGGSRRETLDGRWFGGFQNVIDVSVSKGFGSSGTNGSGKIYLNGSNDFRRLELSGRTRGDRYDVEFRTGSSAGGGWDEIGTISSKGSGKLERSGSADERLTRATVRLMSNGNGEIVIEGRSTHRLDGTWTKRGNSYHFNVRGGFSSSDTSGAATLNLSGGRVNQIIAAGKRNERKFSFRFEGDGKGGNTGESDRLDFSIRHSGSGRYDVVGGPEDSFKRATVTVRRNGSCTIEIHGDSNHRFHGSWRDSGSDQIRVELEGELDNRKVKLSGTVHLDSKEDDWNRFALTGERAGRRMTVSFRT